MYKNPTTGYMDLVYPNNNENELDHMKANIIDMFNRAGEVNIQNIEISDDNIIFTLNMIFNVTYND